MQWIESGDSILALAQDLTKALGVEVARGGLSRLLNDFSPEAEGRLTLARRAGAHGLADKAVDIADSAGDTREDIAKAKLRSDVRQWQAGKWNRDEYGEQRGAHVTINVANLHGNALRSLTIEPDAIHNPLPSVTPHAQLVATVVDAEIEDEQLELDMSPCMPGDAASGQLDLI